MDEQVVRQIAEAAFKSRYGDIAIVCINVERGFDHDDAPVVDIRIIYDGKVEQVDGEGFLRVQSEVVSKVWEDAEDSPGYPLVHFIAKSDIGRRDPATV